MVKKTKKKQPVGITKKQAAHSVRDQQARRRVIIGVTIAVIFIVGVIAAGLIIEFLINPSAPVATVNGERITTSDYQKLVKYQRNNINRYITNIEVEKAKLDPDDENVQSMIQFYDQMLTQAQEQLANVGSSVVEQMIDDLLIHQGAANEGITVSEEQIDEKIEEFFGYQRNPPTPAPTPTPNPDEEDKNGDVPTPAPTQPPMTREEFDSRYARYLDDLKVTTGFDEADYRDLVRGILYREAMQELVEGRAPTTGEQVWARHILVEDEETAQTVLDRLDAGDDFAALAEEFSTDLSNKSDGGDLGWFGRGQMVPEFEEAAFSLSVGEISAPVQTQFGSHIIKVEGHEMDRELDGQALSQLLAGVFDEWLNNARQNADIQRSWTPDKIPPESTPVYGN